MSEIAVQNGNFSKGIYNLALEPLSDLEISKLRANIPLGDLVSLEIIDETYTNHRDNFFKVIMIALGFALLAGIIGYWLGSYFQISYRQHFGWPLALSQGVGGAAFGVIVGALFGDKQKNVTFVATFKNDKCCLAVTDSETYVKIRTAKSFGNSEACFYMKGESTVQTGSSPLPQKID